MSPASMRPAGRPTPWDRESVPQGEGSGSCCTHEVLSP
jgi:hypothetical protein